MSGIDASNRPETEMDTGTPIINLQQFERRLNSKPLDDIAATVQYLTYGEMIELAETIWKCRQEDAAITLENFPALLHRWSKSRSAVAPDTVSK
jgi:hypothetical protein